MARPKTLDRAKYRGGKARKRTSINLLAEAEVALKLYALRMKTPRTRERSVSFAIEHILYQSDDLMALLPEARKIIKDGNADGFRVYRPSNKSTVESTNPKQEQESESEGGQSTTTGE